MAQERPIGYWIRLVDRLLESGLDAELTRDGLTRRHWQVLTVVQELGPVDEAGVARALAPFEPSTDEPVGTAELALLSSRRWVTRGPDGYVLSADGTEHCEALAERVDGFRERSTQGVAADEHATTISVLQRIAANLGWTTPEA
ncbi:MarR family winged helix-turn-helix transcriptional regulator [Cellulomonas biazotea]|jgi:hypothetical protein|uniref:HTH marR-type domain-containing protein n=1 Tax=Cellulomonas biazotea TaxID=1709 RepID=A0A402DN48_9CELL|nr:MarR family transcriptional regulator [Cellulomonas biazotea]GCE75550.1 hypothetical protein CBZ_06060 [Cellulomonas biazotea]